MRARFAKGEGGRRELVVSLRRGEALSPRQAGWLQELRHKNYLPFCYDYHRDATDAVLRYDLTGTMGLRPFLRRRDAGRGLARLLVGLAEALACCVNGGNRYLSLLFDDRHVFVDGEGELRLVFVPVDGLSQGTAHSPLTLLRVLGNARGLGAASPNEVVLCEHVAAFALDAEGVFSLNAYRSFVERECGVLVAADGTVGVCSREGAAPVADDGDRAVARAAGEVEDDAARSVGASRTGAAGELRLVRVSTGEAHVLAGRGELRAGRGSGCEVRVLGNPKVSREHAALRCEGNAVALRDLGSANGTFVGGRRVTGVVRVARGERLCLADEEFLLG